jgi:hypothetical protein
MHWYFGTNDILYHSPADWVAPNSGGADESYLRGPSSAYHGKLVPAELLSVKVSCN